MSEYDPAPNETGAGAAPSGDAESAADGAGPEAVAAGGGETARDDGESADADFADADADFADTDAEFAKSDSGESGRARRRAGRRAPVPPLRPAESFSFNLSKPDLRAWLRTARDGVRGLSDRPLTSFHLVVLLALLLTVIGLIMVQSASSVEGYAQDHSSYGAFTTQTMFAVLGWIAFYVALKLPIRFFQRMSALGMAVSLVLLILVLVPHLGVKVDGARRWFEVAGVSIQPSELAKVALCIWGAQVLATRRSVGVWSRELLSPLVPVATLVCILIIAEPNLSTTVIVALITGALLWFAGLRPSVFAGLAAFFAVAGLILAFTADYRAARIFSFLGGSDDSLDAGYQALQAKYALANGGVFGVGLGQSTAKWSYLPNAHNDFIFAILVEETGLIGGAAVVVLFLMLAYVGMRIARRSVDPFLRLLTATITVLFTAQMFINVGYVVGLLPVTGIQLPLLSQGGTSMLMMLFLLGLMASAARHEPQAVAALAGSTGRRLPGFLRLPRPVAYRAETPPAAVRPDGRRRSAGRVPEVRRTPAAPASGRSRPVGTARRETVARPPRPVRTTPRAPYRAGVREPAPGVVPHTRAEHSDEIHYAARQANSALPRRSAARSRATESPRRTEYRHR